MQTQTRYISDFGSVAVCAIRHCCDRVDSVPPKVIAAVKANWQLLSKNDRIIIKKDVAYTVDNKFVRMEFDVKIWIGFYDWIIENTEIESNNQPITEAVDFGTLTVNAIRYCFGRQSYMPSLITDATKHNWFFVSKGDRATILKDLAEAFQTRSMGNKCDKRNWVNFLNWTIDRLNDENA